MSKSFAYETNIMKIKSHLKTFVITKYKYISSSWFPPQQGVALVGPLPDSVILHSILPPDFQDLPKTRPFAWLCWFPCVRVKPVLMHPLHIHNGGFIIVCFLFDIYSQVYIFRKSIQFEVFCDLVPVGLHLGSIFHVIFEIINLWSVKH